MAAPGRNSTWRGSPLIPCSCASGFSTATAQRRDDRPVRRVKMCDLEAAWRLLLNLPKLVGGGTRGDGGSGPDMPTLRRSAASDAAQAYDPLASTSLMEEVRSAMAETMVPRQGAADRPSADRAAVPGPGRPAGDVPGVRGAHHVARRARRRRRPPRPRRRRRRCRCCRSGSRAAPRWRCGAGAVAFAAVKDARERFKTDLDALQRGGTSRASRSMSCRTTSCTCSCRASRRAGIASTRMSSSCSTTSSSVDRRSRRALGDGRAGQQAARRSRPGAGQARRRARAMSSTRTSLPLLSQRIAKNAAAFVSSPETDPEFAALLARDAGAFRDAQDGLVAGRGCAGAARPGARGEDARAAATELVKRAAAFDAGLPPSCSTRAGSSPPSRRCARVSNEAEGLLTETTKLAEIYKGSGKSRLPMWAAISSRCSRSARCCCSARCSSTTRGCAPTRASRRTSGTRRRSSGC